MMAATTLLVSCGSPNENQTGLNPSEACHADSCSEADLNAPVPGTSEERFEPSFRSKAEDAYEFPAFDPEWGLPAEMYEKARAYYLANIAMIDNTRYVTIVDFTQHSTQKRFYLFDLKEGSLERHNTSHGEKSDRDRDGYATEFSNNVSSHQSSLGFYLTLGTYTGGNGRSLKIRGLEDTNSNAEKRAVVIHPARYVSNKRSKAGMSWGCPALDRAIAQKVIDRIKSGSLLLIDRIEPPVQP
jgi:hypothetical protein